MKRIPHSEEAITTIHDPEDYYQRHKEKAVKRFRPVLKWLIKTKRCGEYLDVGSGPGILAVLLAQSISDIQITLVEPDLQMIQIGKRHIKEAGVEKKVRFAQGPGENRDLMASLGKFDLAYSTYSLHHWKQPVEVLKSIYESIRENGMAVVFDLKRVWWMYYYPSKTGFINSIRAAYTKKELKHMLKQAGIERYQIVTPFPWLWHLIVVEK